MGTWSYLFIIRGNAENHNFFIMSKAIAFSCGYSSSKCGVPELDSLVVASGYYEFVSAKSYCVYILIMPLVYGRAVEILPKADGFVLACGYYEVLVYVAG